MRLTLEQHKDMQDQLRLNGWKFNRLICMWEKQWDRGDHHCKCSLTFKDVIDSYQAETLKETMSQFDQYAEYELDKLESPWRTQ